MPLPKSVLSVAEQEILLKKVRSELRKSKCCRPGLTWRENLAAQFEVSLRAEVKLRKKALVFYRKLHRLQNT